MDDPLGLGCTISELSDDFKFDNMPMACETITLNTYDHKYSMSPPCSSDSGISEPSMSPATSHTDSSGHTSGGDSPTFHSDFDSGIGSPLGGGVEDLKLEDFNFTGLDPSALFEEDCFLKNEDMVVDSRIDIGNYVLCAI